MRFWLNSLFFAFRGYVKSNGGWLYFFCDCIILLTAAWFLYHIDSFFRAALIYTLYLICPDLLYAIYTFMCIYNLIDYNFISRMTWKEYIWYFIFGN